MADAGYLARRPFSPASLAATLAINGGVLAALFLAAPEIVQPIRVITGTIIPTLAPDEPPPLPDTPQLRSDSVQPRIDRPLPSNPIAPSDGGFVFPPLPPLPPVGMGETIVDPLPPAAPRLVGARLVSDPGTLRPPYPPLLQRLEVEGVAVVRVLIGTDGRVKAVELVRADDPLFFEATRTQALRRWRFDPATRDGVPYESWREMRVRFEIDA